MLTRHMLLVQARQLRPDVVQRCQLGSTQRIILNQRLAFEQHLVQHHGKGVDVHLGVVWLVFEDLRRHVPSDDSVHVHTCVAMIWNELLTHIAKDRHEPIHAPDNDLPTSFHNSHQPCRRSPVAACLASELIVLGGGLVVEVLVMDFQGNGSPANRQCLALWETV